MLSHHAHRADQQGKASSFGSMDPTSLSLKFWVAAGDHSRQGRGTWSAAGTTGLEEMIAAVFEEIAAVDDDPRCRVRA